MYLHTLGIQAIGPFAGTHVIDVAALASSGIFLLEGPTGSGKSTIIDSVVFALYGKVAGHDASDDRLRSAFAGPHSESFVDLVFETPAGVFRIRRTPEYQRPKKRGTGTTTQHASAALWRLGAVPDPTNDNPSGTLLSTRLDEIGLEIRRIVGLDRQQFVQTVVLPQGEFAQFLRAEPEDRGKLLQRVFATEIYDGLANQLAEMRRTATRAVDQAHDRLASSVDHLIGASGASGEHLDALHRARGPEQDPSAVLSALSLLLDDLDAAATATTERETAAAAAATDARQIADDATRQVAALRRRDELREQFQALQQQADHVDQWRVLLDTDQRAMAVRGAVERAHSAEVAHQAALAHRDLAASTLPTALVAEGPDRWRQWLAECAQVRARLIRPAELCASFPDRERALETLRDELAVSTAERELLNIEAAARPAARAAREAHAQALHEIASTAPLREAHLTDAIAVHDGVRDLDALAAELSEATADRDAAVSAADHAVRHEAAQRRARIAGIAGELAQDLRDGEPCVVCGSGTHPHPARLDSAHVGAADVDRAEAQRVAAEDAVRAIGERVASLNERWTAGRRLAGDASLAAAADAVQTARDLLGEAHEAIEGSAQARAALREFDQEAVAALARSSDLDTRIAVGTAAIAQASHALEIDRAEVARQIAAAEPLLAGVLPDSGAETEAVGELRASLDRLAHDVEDLQNAEAALLVASATAADCSRELAAELERHGFLDVPGVLAALLDPEERARLDQQVSEHEIAITSVASAAAEYADLADHEPERAESLADAARRDADVADDAWRAATSDRGVAEQARQATRTAARDVGIALESWRTARTDAEPVARMAALASGIAADNPRALSLATFVLVRRFEDVVAAANDRLVEMSSGRYELAYSATREHVRARRTGLALQVNDHVAGRSRDPRTLSGGETFYVSLCLALGLADVVSAEAGGVELGTLFVDEGFGSLDAATLDAVLSALGALRDGGRVVAVVSHVDALKQQIAERIEVRPAPGGGSTLRVRS